MSKRGVRLFLTDMLDAIGKTERYTAGLTFAEFERNDLVVDGVTRNLEIIGEAAKYIPPELQARYGTAIEWHKVTGFRNIVIHQYFAVDVSIVWTIATQRLGDLKSVVQKMLSDMSNEQRT